jgi:hypothetical protein
MATEIVKQMCGKPDGPTVQIRTYVRKRKLSAHFDLDASQIVRASPLGTLCIRCAARSTPRGRTTISLTSPSSTPTKRTVRQAGGQPRALREGHRGASPNGRGFIAEGRESSSRPLARWPVPIQVPWEVASRTFGLRPPCVYLEVRAR